MGLLFTERPWRTARSLAVKEINADGGINGIQIEFNFQDDENDAEKAVNAYNTLKDWGMQALLGTVTSAPCVAVGEVAQGDNMFLLTPSGTAVECVQYDNAFRVCFSDPMQGLESAKYIGENKLATKVAVIYDSSDVYSTGIYQAFATEAKNQGLELVATEAFTSESKTDFSVQAPEGEGRGRGTGIPAVLLFRGGACAPAGGRHQLCSDLLRMRWYGRYPWSGRI